MRGKINSRERQKQERMIKRKREKFTGHLKRKKKNEKNVWEARTNIE